MHRDGGPAIILKDNVSYWLHGKEFNEKDYMIYLFNKKLKNDLDIKGKIKKNKI